MFSKPVIGWTKWTVEGHANGSVSYLEDVPYKFITACCDYLKLPNGFNLVMDGEGNDHGLSLIGDYFCVYSFDGDEPPYLSEITPVSDRILDDETDGIAFVEKMLREAINDFERDFEEWALWNVGDYENEEEKETESMNLRHIIDYGKNVLAVKPSRGLELGNLLFGNSRGAYPVDREPIDKIFWENFEDFFDYHCCLTDERLSAYETDRGGYENDVFCINPYYWGDDDDIAELPNFIYKPENIEISWYKYPMRDAWSNVPITEETARRIFSECRKSIEV